MNNVNICNKNWVDLVFEDKNKNYGAYRLRLESNKTILKAFCISIVLLSSILFLAFSASSKEVPPLETIYRIDNPTLTLANLKPYLPKENMSKPKTRTPLNTENTQKNNTILVVATSSEVLETPPVKETIIENPTIENTNGNGLLDVITTNRGIFDSSLLNTDKKDILKTFELDESPYFPGGIENFYKYIQNNIENPEIDYNSNTPLSVTISFVIEIDGSLTDIKVLKSNNQELETASIKVLKSLKTKWTPGIKKGKKVRTLYSLPIRLKK